MKTIARALALSLFLPLLAAAQTALTGRWEGETRSGARVELDATATGPTLKGTITHRGETAAISDGKVSKTGFTFTATVDGRTDGFTGEIGTDQITLWPNSLGTANAVVLKRAHALTGKWRGQTPNGADLVLDLTAGETALTGTLTRNGQPAALSEGKVSKNTFTFKTTVASTTEAFTGEVGSDQITVWLDRRGPASSVTLKRAK